MPADSLGIKEHRKVEQLEATVARQQENFQATVAVLTTSLKEQAAQIQKVSEQLASNQTAPPMLVKSR
jgi:hypothetical protein